MSSALQTYSILFCNEFFNNAIKKTLSSLQAIGTPSAGIADEIGRMSAGADLGGNRSELIEIIGGGAGI
jgi:hypothetical protein